MADPVFMTEQTLNAVKGWPSQSAVDYHAAFSSDALELLDPVPPGHVVHLNADGEFDLGVGNLDVMPMFTFNASNDPDVVNPGGNPATKKGAWVAVSPTGQALALVGCGAYELVSTAYDPDDEDDLVPNALLTSPTSGANAGKLVPGIKGTNMICAMVSRGVVDNGYGTNAVAFWPILIFPAA